MEQFLETYRNLGRDTVATIETIYTPDVHFIDPAHEIHGLAHLRRYMEHLYERVERASFEFAHHARYDAEGYVQWLMHFSHPRLGGGREITVAGASFLRFSPDSKVHYHRDYYDLGAMLYEHVPLVGPVVKTIKGRLGA